MMITGFQPLSLLDYPGVICSIVFTQGCPFRCVYCHNPELIPAAPLRSQTAIPPVDVLRQLAQHKKLIEGVCITGGEPTMHTDLPAFIQELKRLGLLVKLDTNGVHPRMIRDILERRLVDFIAMDLKHTWERYADVIGLPQPGVVEQCRETFALIQISGIRHEFRTTVYPGLHQIEDLLAMAELLRDGETYALQQIRYNHTLAELDRHPDYDLESVAFMIRKRRPDLRVEVRV